jgi:thiosulfate/3-mercaptopyruvate sulfurtransferase
MPSPLITPEALAPLVGTPRVRILDVRWRLDRPDGRPDYLAGHLPGAVYVDLDSELAEHGEPTDGRHPLPSLARLQQSARRWGLDDGDTVVVYDDLKNLSAARAWWLLRYAGVGDVRVLDGSLRGWTTAGFELETGDVVPPIGSITLNYGALPVLDIDQAAALPARGVLLDARAAERYRGEVEPIDPRAGHIPGAISAPTTENVDPAGRFLDPATLRERFVGLGVADGVPLGVYCGSGVTAAHDALALTLAGFSPALYPGSWSQWSHTPERPVAVGSRPEGEAS